MSKLAESLRIEPTGKLTGLLGSVLSVNEAFRAPDLKTGGIRVAREYILESRLAVLMRVDETLPNDAHQYVKDSLACSARRSIIEAVFGEFRDPLCRLRNALSERDWDSAWLIAQEIEKTMFEYGI